MPCWRACLSEVPLKTMLSQAWLRRGRGGKLLTELCFHVLPGFPLPSCRREPWRAQQKTLPALRNRCIKEHRFGGREICMLHGSYIAKGVLKIKSQGASYKGHLITEWLGQQANASTEYLQSRHIFQCL